MDNLSIGAKRRPQQTSLNSVVLVGRLCADPVVRTLASGTTIARLRIATNDLARAEFHDVVCWEAAAEGVRALKKGQLARVEGRLHSDKWTAKDGTTRRTVEVVAVEVKTL